MSCDQLAITGIACRLPGCNTPEEFWSLLLKGTDACAQVPRSLYDIDAYYDESGKGRNKSGARFGNWLNGVEKQFDPAFFGLSDAAAASMDPQQRLALMVAFEALEDAGWPLSDDAVATSACCHVAAVCDDYREHLYKAVDANFYPGTARENLAHRISAALGMGGQSYTVDTACNASLFGLDLACAAIRSGRSRLALVGGVSINTQPQISIALDKAYFMSRTGQCHTLDETADGYSRADAVNFIVLRPLPDALAHGDRIYGLINAIDTNHSGESKSITYPHAPAQAQLMQSILRQSHLQPGDVSVVEAHGTGTQGGDLNEVTSITQTFEKGIIYTSSKANVGHSEGASGLTAVIKAMLMITHRAVPPHIGISTRLNPTLEHLVKAADMRIAVGEAIDLAGRDTVNICVNNFGAAGGNTSTILTSFAPVMRLPSGPLPEGTSEILFVSARSEIALRKRLLQLAEVCEEADTPLVDISYTTLCRWSVHPQKRVSIRATDKTQAATALRTAAYSNQALPESTVLMRNLHVHVQLVPYKEAMKQFSELANRSAAFRDVLENHNTTLITTGRPLIEFDGTVGFPDDHEARSIVAALWDCWLQVLVGLAPAGRISGKLFGPHTHTVDKAGIDSAATQGSEVPGVKGIDVDVRGLHPLNALTLGVTTLLEEGHTFCVQKLRRTLFDGAASVTLPSYPFELRDFMEPYTDVALMSPSWSDAPRRVRRPHIEDRRHMGALLRPADGQNWYVVEKEAQAKALGAGPALMIAVLPEVVQLQDTCMLEIEWLAWPSKEVSLQVLINHHTGDNMQSTLDGITLQTSEGARQGSARHFCGQDQSLMLAAAKPLVNQKLRSLAADPLANRLRSAMLDRITGRSAPQGLSDVRYSASSISATLLLCKDALDRYEAICSSFETLGEVLVARHRQSYSGIKLRPLCTLRGTWNTACLLKQDRVDIVGSVLRTDREGKSVQVTFAIASALDGALLAYLPACSYRFQEDETTVGAGMLTKSQDVYHGPTSNQIPSGLRPKPSEDRNTHSKPKDSGCAAHTHSSSDILRTALDIMSDQVGCTASDITAAGTLFADVGIDSLMTLTILDRLRETFPNLDLPGSLFIDCESWEDLQSFLTADLSTVDRGNAALYNGRQSSPSGSVTSSKNVNNTPATSDYSCEDSEKLHLEGAVAMEAGDGAVMIQTIIRVIAEETGVKVTELEDGASFADMGIDSLMSLSILDVLREQLPECEVPGSLFLDCETIADLKIYFNVSETQAKSSEETPSMSGEVDKLEYETKSVVLSNGAGDSKQKSPLWLIPDGSGTPAVFAGMPTMGRPIYGVTSPFLRQGSTVKWDGGVEQIARLYVGQIKRRQPAGPYLLGGWSFGGVVAYEAACQLLAVGDSVSGIVLLDAPCPRHMPALPPEILDWALQAAPRLGLEIKSFSGAMSDHFRQAISHLDPYDPKPLYGVEDASAALSRTPRAVLVTALEGVDADPNDVTNTNAAVTWMFTSRQGLGTNGWSRLCGSGQTRVIESDGNHFTMMQRPYVTRWTADLAKELDWWGV